MSREQQDKRREILTKTEERIAEVQELQRYKIALQRIAFGGYSCSPTGYKNAFERAKLIAEEALQEPKKKKQDLTLEVGKVYRSVNMQDTWAVIAERRGQFICVNSYNGVATFEKNGYSTALHIPDIDPFSVIGEDDEK